VNRKMMDMDKERIADLCRGGHAHNIARGVPLDKLTAEIVVEATGLCGGRGG